MRATVLSSLAVLVSLSCASPGTQPKAMSAQAHEESAQAHQAEAGAHGAEFDPGATTTRVPIQERARAAAGRRGDVDFFYPLEEYNPTQQHAAKAKQHAAVAEQHMKAAAKLRAFEEGACRTLPANVRAECPLMGQVASVDDVPGGVRITFAKGLEQEAAMAHVACHVAFAATNGFADMDGCPLFERTARVDAEGDSLFITSPDAAAVERIRTTARAHQ